MSEHPETRDLLGPFVMGDLDPAEKRAVEEHLENCASCRQEVESLRLAHENLVEFAAASEAPPEHLKDRAVAGMPGPAVRRLVPPWAAAAAAALLLAAGLAYGTSLLGGREVAAATLEPTDRAPRAGGEVKVMGGGENAEVRLEAWGLPACEDEEYYELWLVEGEERVSAGTFSVGKSGEVEVVLNAPEFADAYPQVGITAETDTDPSPGDAKMLGGKLRGT
ncbi:MAG TPA: anti-sigma factor [Rubrobacter sp.]|nr:anti-sigma factor [Rubrobacter sp.]